MHLPFSFGEGWIAFSFEGRLARTTFECRIIIINVITIIFSLCFLLAFPFFEGFMRLESILEKIIAWRLPLIAHRVNQHIQIGKPYPGKSNCVLLHVPGYLVRDTW